VLLARALIGATADDPDDCANHGRALRAPCAIRSRLTERQAIPMFGWEADRLAAGRGAVNGATGRWHRTV